jgi:deoxyribodipyrimidine photo-lyase
MLTVIWHRRDLRLDDHPAIDYAQQIGGQIIGVFIFDPAILKQPSDQLTTGGGQVEFMLGCLAELQADYQRLGSNLYFFYGNPVERLTHIALTLKPDHLCFCEDVEPFAIRRDREARLALQRLGVKVHSFIDLGLHDPQAIRTSTGEPYKVYTPFWRNWRKLEKPRPFPPPRALAGIVPPLELEHIPLPSVSELGFSHQQSIPKAGSAQGVRLLQQFTESQALLRYQENRNYPAIAGTSQLSPHLRFGTIGIRRVWSATVKAEEMVRSQEEQQSIETWRQELAWREFYQHVLFFFPELETSAYRPEMQKFPWSDRYDYFEAWCAGRTGYPIVDAAMRQLNATGWMHNRCRMIVASFLTKDLLINWQWGERYFMQKLVDADLSANNGGWQWSASSGMDPKPLRIFNPASQASKFDPEAVYIRQWLPELSRLPTADLLSGEISPLDRQRCDYPPPIVDHKRQQQIFKTEYAKCRS